MIKPICYKCGKEFYEYGAILVSPPLDFIHPRDMVDRAISRNLKFHICLTCYGLIYDFIKNNDLQP